MAVLLTFRHIRRPAVLAVLFEAGKDEDAHLVVVQHDLDVVDVIAFEQLLDWETSVREESFALRIPSGQVARLKDPVGQNLFRGEIAVRERLSDADLASEVVWLASMHSAARARLPCRRSCALDLREPCEARVASVPS